MEVLRSARAISANPRNAGDWPMFNVVIERLVSTALNLAAQSGILANDPDLITDKLEVLIKAANPGVAAAARKELLEMTTMCNQSGPIASGWGPTLGRNDFMDGKVYSEPGDSPEQRERTYWRLKEYSCSDLPQVRAKAGALLHRYFTDRQTIGCEICRGRLPK